MSKGEFIMTAIEDGLSDKDILTAAEVAMMPTTLNSVKWYRSKMKKGAAKKIKLSPKEGLPTVVEPIFVNNLVPVAGKPIIELKSIKLHKGLSEETPCYQAKAFVDGKHIADVSNHGHGGCDMVYFVNGYKREDFAALEKQIIETYPKHECKWGDGTPMDESFEMLCHMFVWKKDDITQTARKLKNRLYFKRTDGKIAYVTKMKPTDPKARAYVAEKHVGAIIVNDLPFDEAVELLYSSGC